MHMVMAVDWSEESFAALEQATTLYLPQEVSLAHGVDLGIFQYPMVAEAGNVQGYDEFRHAMQEAGRQLLLRTSALIPKDVRSVTTICEFAKPAALVLDTATKQAADMIVVGAGGRGRMAELLLGSISHRIALHAPCSTLIVKRSQADIRNALVAVEDRDDAGRIRDWLRRHPFRHLVDLTLVHVVEPLPAVNTFDLLPITAWLDAATTSADDLVRETAASLAHSYPDVTTKVLTGNPVEAIAKEAEHHDLLVVGSHGRKGIERFLLGSVSHTLLHQSPRSVLVVR